MEAHEARDGGESGDQDGLDLGACQYIIDVHPRDRLRQAGVLSGKFWLTK
ncbi:MAG: hypothetical protein P4L84_25650 [Isosphaeraceae bacterium]|nr:hypothetical protein [Isosphaeraceae bacterium]